MPLAPLASSDSWAKVSANTSSSSAHTLTGSVSITSLNDWLFSTTRGTLLLSTDITGAGSVKECSDTRLVADAVELSEFCGVNTLTSKDERSENVASGTVEVGESRCKSGFVASRRKSPRVKPELVSTDCRDHSREHDVELTADSSPDPDLDHCCEAAGSP